MDRTLQECLPATDSTTVSQGDVFRWTRVEPASPYGIIVTADCDIEHEKFGTHLTYAPILDLTSYLETYLLRDRLEDARSAVLERIGGIIWRLQQKGRPELTRKLTGDVLERWISSRTLDEILVALNCTADDPRKVKLQSELAVRRELEAVRVSGGTAGQMISAIAVALQTETSKVHERIHNHILSLPGDRMFISTVDGEMQDGFVVLLRNLREITLDEIAVRPDQEQSRPAVRVARLSSPFRYRMTQQLGEIFSAIGLPREYEDMRKQILSSTFQVRTKS